MPGVPVFMGGGHPGCSGVTTALPPSCADGVLWTRYLYQRTDVSIKASKGALPRLPPANRYCAWAVCVRSASTSVAPVGARVKHGRCL